MKVASLVNVQQYSIPTTVENQLQDSKHASAAVVLWHFQYSKLKDCDETP